MRYKVTLGAGSRPQGAGQFGSTAERRHYQECVEWLLSLYPDAIVLEQLGCVLIDAEDPTYLEQDPRVLRVTKEVPRTVSAVQAGAPWGLSRISERLDDKYDFTTTGRGVTAYILDTGVDIYHNEFEGRATRGFWVGAETPLGDHGTHVAGTVGSKTYGVAKDVSIIDVKVFDTENASTADIIQGLNWIISHHQAGEPAVANMSFGGPYDPDEEDAVLAAIADGIVCVATAGNDAEDVGTRSPGSITGVVCVGAIDVDGKIADFSNFGTRIDIMAPGVGVLSTVPGGGVATLNGTSMAAPHVAGVIARYLEVYRNADPAAVRRDLFRCAAYNTLDLDGHFDTINRELLANVTVSLPTGSLWEGYDPSRRYQYIEYYELAGERYYGQTRQLEPLAQAAVTKNYGQMITTTAAVRMEVVKPAFGENFSGGQSTEEGLTKVVQLLIDPAEYKSMSISINKSSGTVSFVMLSEPSFAVKDLLNIQGVQCQVERIGPDVAGSDFGWSVEGRIIPPFKQEFVSVNYPDMQDGTTYSLADVLTDIAGQAGTKVVNMLGSRAVKSFVFSGRYINALEQLASDLCGQFVQQNGQWFLVSRDYSMGDFSVQTQDVISLNTSKQGDIVDEVMDLATSLRDTLVSNGKLKDEIDELEKELEKLKKARAAVKDDEEEEDIDSKIKSALAYLGPINFEFGWKGGKAQQLDSSCEIEGGQWDAFTPQENTTINPENRSRAYYQLKEILNEGMPTGAYLGCYDMTSGRILVEVQEPSNASGMYYAKGLCSNIIGGPATTFDWEPITPKYKRVQKVDAEGKVTWETKMYFEFQTRPLRWSGGTSDDQKDGRLYRVNLDLAYIPLGFLAWQFTGNIDYSSWPVQKNGNLVGTISPDGSFKDITGNTLYEFTTLDELPGDLAQGNVLRDGSSNLAGRVYAGSVYTNGGEYAGSLSAGGEILLGGSNGPSIGLTKPNLQDKAWPGFLIGYEADEPVPLYLLEEMPSSLGYDFSEFDPTDPDAWEAPEGKTPAELTRADLDKQIADLVDRLANLKADLEVGVAKVACITKQLNAYGASVVIAAARSSADAWLAHYREEEHQQKYSLKNKDKLKQLFQTAVTKDKDLMAAASSVGSIIRVTNCTFIYSGTLPLPHSAFSAVYPSGQPGKTDRAEGVIDSVSLTLGNGSCTVTVQATQLKV